MLPLPTNSRSFYTALLRHDGLTEEEIAEVIDDLSSFEGTFLMLQGGGAGVASIKVPDEPDFISYFGECRQLVEIYKLAVDVYKFPVLLPEVLCEDSDLYQSLC